MVLKKLMGIFAITLVICAASLATAGVPDVTKCNVSVNHTGFAVVMNSPNGNGIGFDVAYPCVTDPVTLITTCTDATIYVVVNDATPDPIANYPFEDIWVESVDGGMVACTGGATADASTDAMGMTEFKTPLQAGGWSQADTRVMINGNAIAATVSVGYTSPDISGDGLVNLTDVQVFAADLYADDAGTYNFRSDFLYDLDINVSDLQKLAAQLGASCP